MVEVTGRWLEGVPYNELHVQVVRDDQSVLPGLDVDRGTIEFGDEYKVPTVQTSFHGALGVSAAEYGLKYTSPDGQTIYAELFGPDENTGEFTDDAFELYPLDGNDRPIEVRVDEIDGNVPLAQVCVVALYMYMQNKAAPTTRSLEMQ